MISVNGNTELVIFGGYSDLVSDYVKDIWKYTYPTDTWKIIGAMNNPRADMLTFIVEDIECP